MIEMNRKGLISSTKISTTYSPTVYTSEAQTHHGVSGFRANRWDSNPRYR